MRFLLQMTYKLNPTLTCWVCGVSVFLSDSTFYFLKNFNVFLVSLCFSKMFSVQLSLGEQTWESEGSSIKKAQQAVANKALTESTLPKPVQKPPKSNVNNNPGMALTWFLVFCPLHVLFPVFSFTQACCIVSGCSDSRIVTEDERMKKVIVVILKFCFNGYSKGALLTF